MEGFAFQDFDIYFGKYENTKNYGNLDKKSFDRTALKIQISYETVIPAYMQDFCEDLSINEDWTILATHIAPQSLDASYWGTQHRFRTFLDRQDYTVSLPIQSHFAAVVMYKLCTYHPQLITSCLAQ